MSEGKGRSNSCYSCSKKMDTIFVCDACEEVQPPENVNAFRVFGWEVNLPIDEAKVQERYMKLQKRIHPDAVLNLSEQSQLYAPQWSAALNHAYALLKSPLHCLRLVLQQEGCDLDSLSVDPDVLEEGIAIQEQIAQMEGKTETEIAPKLGDLREKEIDYINEAIAHWQSRQIDLAVTTYFKANQIHKSLQRFLTKVRSSV